MTESNGEQSSNWVKNTARDPRFIVGLVLILGGTISSYLLCTAEIAAVAVVGGVAVAYAAFTEYVSQREAKPLESMPRSTFELYRFMTYVLIFISGTMLGLIGRYGGGTPLSAVSLVIAIVAGILLVDFLGGGVRKDEELADNENKEHVIKLDPVSKAIVVTMLNIEMAAFLIGVVSVAWTMI